jgi:hypothetical protein
MKYNWVCVAGSFCLLVSRRKGKGGVEYLGGHEMVLVHFEQSIFDLLLVSLGTQAYEQETPNLKNYEVQIIHIVAIQGHRGD